MILTKDNLLRFVREKKYVTPTDVASSFDTSTMIASAALSELAKEKLVLISNLKIGSTPYYYDPRQRECLIELGEKHFSKYEKDTFNKLKNQQVINQNFLSIQEKLAIEKLKDFAIPLVISYQGKELIFWVWYLRDLNETKKQILSALKGDEMQSEKSQIKQVNSKKENLKSQVQKSISNKNLINKSKEEQNMQNLSSSNQNFTKQTGVFKPQTVQKEVSQENKVEMFIYNFLEENYLKVLEKETKDKGVLYRASVLINKVEVIFECFYFEKKPKDSDIIKFYSSSSSPKVIFICNAAKKFFKLAEELDNLTIVNV